MFNQRFASVRKTLAHGLLFVALAGLAGAASAQEPLNVAVLDVAAALFNSDRARALTEQLREETAEDEQKVRNLAEQATKLQEKLQQDGAVMSDSERRNTNGEIEEIGVQYQYLVQKIQGLVQERQQQFQNTYAPNLNQAVTAVVEEGGYDLVLRAEAALYFRSAYDITALVTEKLNQQQ